MQTTTTTAPIAPTTPRPKRRSRRGRARNGTGCLVRQTGPGKSKNYIAQWYEDGVRKTKSTGTSDEREAQAFLNARLGKVATGEPDPLPARRTKTSAPATNPALAWRAAVEAYEKDQQRQKRGAVAQNLKTLAKHLTPVFGTRTIDTITTRDLADFASAQLERFALATVRSHVAILRRLLNVAREQGHLAAAPTITLGEPDNARQGFFEREELDAILPQLPRYLQRPVTVAYCTGWRFNSEVVTLPWTQVDMGRRTMKLRTSKTGKPRTFPFRLFPELEAVFVELHAERQARRAAGLPVSPLVFVDDAQAPLFNTSAGRRVGPLKQTTVWRPWRAALTRANVEGKIFHDFRRTAVRNLVHAGVPQGTAMKLTGHTTLEVFERYNIVDERDLNDAVERYAAHLRISPQSTADARTAPQMAAVLAQLSAADVAALLAMWEQRAAA